MSRLRIVESKIEVSRNPLIEGGLSFHHKVRGVFPCCRKVATLFLSASYGYIRAQNLSGGSGRANIMPEDWAVLVKQSPVVVAPHYRYRSIPGQPRVILTDDIITTARERAMLPVTQAIAMAPEKPVVLEGYEGIELPMSNDAYKEGNL